MNLKDTIIMKFGGTSVGSASKIKHVAQLISDDNPKLVVLSAMSGVTNKLVEISEHFALRNLNAVKGCLEDLKERYFTEVEALYKKELTQRAVKTFIQKKLDYIWSFGDDLFTIFEEKAVLAQGEMISTEMMKHYLDEQEIDVVKLCALDFMCTDKFGEPDLSKISEKLISIMKTYEGKKLYLTEGYICKNAYDEIDNLQRGGSDYTATLIGAAIDAKEIQIWTDIDGLHNNDPRVVGNTQPVRGLHFNEAAELAYFGAKILHPTCITPARQHNIPVKLLNTMDPTAAGTLISNVINTGSIRAVAAKDNITALKINSTRMLLSYGFLKKVFETFEKHQTAIDMVTTSEVSVSVTIDRNDRLQDIIAELKHFSSVSVDQDMVIICIVGDLNWKNVGFESSIVEALHDIPIRMISYGGSNYNVSVLVRKDDKKRALESLSKHLFDDVTGK